MTVFRMYWSPEQRGIWKNLGLPIETPQEALHLAGPCIEVAITQTGDDIQNMSEERKDIPDAQTGWAMIDSGTQTSLVDKDTCRSLDLVSIGKSDIFHGGGEGTSDVYRIRVQLPSPLKPLENLRVIAAPLRRGPALPILMLGRDFLLDYGLMYYGSKGYFDLVPRDDLPEILPELP